MIEKAIPDLFGALAARLKIVRRFRRRTQLQVAEQLRINYRHLQKVEGGKTDFKLSTLDRLSKLFEIKPCFLANTNADNLFAAASLPCHALLLDALSLSLILVDHDGATIYRNQMAKQLLASLSGKPGAEGAFLKELASRAALLQAGHTVIHWQPEASQYAPGLSVEAILHPAPDGSRQVLFTIEAPALDATPKPPQMGRVEQQALHAVPAANIRRYRKANQLTQADAAAAMAMSLRYFQKVESGRLDLKCSTLAKVADALTVSPCQLLVEESLRTTHANSYPCLASLVDHLPYGLVLVGPQGQLAYANAAFMALFGRTSAPTEPSLYWNLFDTEEEREEARNFLMAAFVAEGAGGAAIPFHRGGIRWELLMGENLRANGIMGLAR